jgi:hypothetical protein
VTYFRWVHQADMRNVGYVYEPLIVLFKANLQRMTMFVNNSRILYLSFI